MSEAIHIVQEMAHRLFEKTMTPAHLHAAERGEWQGEVWDAVEQSGFLDCLVDGASSNAERFDVMAAFLKVAALHLAPLPLGETILVRGVLTRRGIRPPGGPLTIGVLDGHTHRHGDHAHLKGTAVRVGYARFATNVLLARHEGNEGVLVAVKRGKLSPSQNMAGEPRDDLVFADTAGTTVDGIDGNLVAAWGAALRSVMMAGATERILIQTVEYAKTRSQFGSAIGKFQAVQQQLAVLAGQLAMANISALAAIRDLENPQQLLKSAAAAKICCGEAAGIAAAISHQLHGAIGITREHDLHFATRRLWSYRAEFGGESHWAFRLGQDIVSRWPAEYWEGITQN